MEEAGMLAVFRFAAAFLYVMYSSSSNFKKLVVCKHLLISLVPVMTLKIASSSWPGVVETCTYCEALVKLPWSSNGGNAPICPLGRKQNKLRFSMRHIRPTTREAEHVLIKVIFLVSKFIFWMFSSRDETASMMTWATGYKKQKKLAFFTS